LNSNISGRTIASISARSVGTEPFAGFVTRKDAVSVTLVFVFTNALYHMVSIFTSNRLRFVTVIRVVATVFTGLFTGLFTGFFTGLLRKHAVLVVELLSCHVSEFVRNILIDVGQGTLRCTIAGIAAHRVIIADRVGNMGTVIVPSAAIIDLLTSATVGELVMLVTPAFVRAVPIGTTAVNTSISAGARTVDNISTNTVIVLPSIITLTGIVPLSVYTHSLVWLVARKHSNVALCTLVDILTICGFSLQGNIFPPSGAITSPAPGSVSTILWVATIMCTIIALVVIDTRSIIGFFVSG